MHHVAPFSGRHEMPARKPLADRVLTLKPEPSQWAMGMPWSSGPMIEGKPRATQQLLPDVQEMPFRTRLAPSTWGVGFSADHDVPSQRSATPSGKSAPSWPWV